MPPVQVERRGGIEQLRFTVKLKPEPATAG